MAQQISAAVLSNSNLYDENGLPVQAIMEARFVLRTDKMELRRVQIGKKELPTRFHYEVTLTIDSINPEIKYAIIDSIENLRPYIVNSLVGEMIDTINNTKQRVRVKNIYFIPDELEVFALNANTDDKSNYSITGTSTAKIEYIDKFPVPIEEI